MKSLQSFCHNIWNNLVNTLHIYNIRAPSVAGKLAINQLEHETFLPKMQLIAEDKSSKQPKIMFFQIL